MLLIYSKNYIFYLCTVSMCSMFFGPGILSIYCRNPILNFFRQLNIKILPHASRTVLDVDG